MVLLLGVAACGEVIKDGPTDAPGEAQISDAPGPAVDCKAQRAVHLVAGTGGLAWFTLVWPAPAVITGFQTAYAYDNPANAKDVTTDPAHPLFARRIGTGALWEGIGKDPQPSVFLAGVNETHTNTPSSIMINGNVGLAAAGAAIQASLQPMIGAIQVSPSGPYGTATGAPALVSVPNADGAVAVFPPAIQQQLRPSAAQLASYIPPGAVQAETNLGTALAFAANAFRLGVLGSLILPAFNDDPHAAFNAGAPTQRMNNLTAMLDAFYRDLATSSELSCGRGGNFLSLADNVVLVVTGDTPKSSFNNAGWPDGTINNSNWMYVRSNGFTKPGWFGQITPNGRTNFNPTTGALDSAATTASDTAAAFAGALYAIARGDKMKVQSFTTAPFDGVIR